MFTHVRDWIDIRKAPDEKETSRWIKLTHNAVPMLSRNLLMDIYKNPHKYVIVLGRDTITVPGVSHPVPTIRVANKEVMASVGLDEGDFLHFLECESVEYNAGMEISRINKRINHLKKKLDNSKTS